MRKSSPKPQNPTDQKKFKYQIHKNINIGYALNLILLLFGEQILWQKILPAISDVEI